MTSHQRVANHDAEYFTIEGTSQRRRIGFGAQAVPCANAHAPEDSAIRDIWLLPPGNPKLHAGRKVAVVATDGVEEIELNTVLHYFRSRGAQVDLIAPKKPSYPYFLGLQIPAVRETHIITITFIAPGGWIRFDWHLGDAS